MPKAIVTGAGRGLGYAIAERLRREGFEVIGLDIAGPNIEPCDITDTARLAELAAEIGPVDALVNNAGVWSFGGLADIAEDEFRRVLETNVIGTFNVIRAFGEPMRRNGGGAIVNIVSIAAHSANPMAGSYSPSKNGVLALTRQAALEWGPDGVRVNAVGPGFIPTEGTDAVYNDARVREVRASVVPLRRLGEPDDIASTVAFLVSDDAAYITGQVIYVDGGYTEALMTLVPRPDDVPGPHL